MVGKLYVLVIAGSNQLCKYIIIGSIYHSPDRKYDNIDFNIIKEHMDIIKDRYKEKNKNIIFHVNGDLNAKNSIW